MQRALALCLAGGIVAVFGIAIQLSPDERGFGTHEQLGMPPCQFRILTGWKCPHCGMTTSFAHVVRGQWIQAFEANAAGLLLAATGVVLAGWGITVAVTGRKLGPDEPVAWLIKGIMLYLVITLVLWVAQTLFF